MSSERGNFGTKMGVVLATAGSAVGLGNIWRFPYMTGHNGGAAFIIIYFACVLLLGIPGMLSEFIIGRHSAANAARAYSRLSEEAQADVNGSSTIRGGLAMVMNRLSRMIGYMGVITSMIILGFYSVVAGW